MLVYFKANDTLGTIEVPDGTSNTNIRTMIADQLPIDAAVIEISHRPFPEPLLPAAVDAKYGEIYSKIVGLENSDLWPAKLNAAHTVLQNATGTPVYNQAYQRLALLLHPNDIIIAGNQEAAVHLLAEKIDRKSTATALLLFELDGLRRTFYQDLEKFNLDVVDDTIQQLIRGTIAKMDRVA